MIIQKFISKDFCEYHIIDYIYYIVKIRELLKYKNYYCIIYK